MPNNAHTQSSPKVLPRRSHTANVQQPRSGVRQDNPTPQRARIATTQPAPPKKGMRPTPKDVYTTRTQQTPSKKRKTVHLTLWVRPGVKAELQRIAEQEGLSVSKTGAAFLEEAIRQKLHTQHAVLLQPIIEQAIRKQMRSLGNRLAVLLVRNAYASEQTRSLVTNILGRQPGVTPKVLTTILDGSSKAAKRNITHRTPQLEAIIAELEQIFTERGEKDGSE